MGCIAREKNGKREILFLTEYVLSNGKTVSSFCYWEKCNSSNNPEGMRMLVDRNYLSKYGVGKLELDRLLPLQPVMI